MTLKTKEIEIEGVKFTIKELSTEEGLELTKHGRNQIQEAAKDFLIKSIVEPKDLNLSDLPFRIGNKLIREINELNGLGEGFTAVPEA